MGRFLGCAISKRINLAGVPPAFESGRKVGSFDKNLPCGSVRLNDVHSRTRQNQEFRPAKPPPAASKIMQRLQLLYV